MAQVYKINDEFSNLKNILERSKCGCNFPGPHSPSGDGGSVSWAPLATLVTAVGVLGSTRPLMTAVRVIRSFLCIPRKGVPLNLEMN